MNIQHVPYVFNQEVARSQNSAYWIREIVHNEAEQLGRTCLDPRNLPPSSNGLQRGSLLPLARIQLSERHPHRGGMSGCGVCQARRRLACFKVPPCRDDHEGVP